MTDNNNIDGKSWTKYKENVANLRKTYDKETYLKDTKIVVKKQHHSYKITPNQENFQIKVDLHGKTEEEAYGLLEKTFIYCINNNIRKILVITGKGYYDAPYDRDQKGLIRTEFVKWVKYSKLSPLVTDFSNASIKDGGDGAFYVTLKKIDSKTIKNGLRKKT